MKKLLNHNSVAAGIIAALGSEVLCAALLWGVLLIAGLPAEEHLRWFAVAFVPPVLLLRYYAKQKEYPTTLKTILVTFFVTFVAFAWLLLKYKHITFN